MNKIFFPFLLLSLLILNGCSKDGQATLDVIQDKLTDNIQLFVGKGDIALKKYENKIKEVKDNLIKVKVSVKVFQQKLDRKKVALSDLQTSDKAVTNKETKLMLLETAVTDMTLLLDQLKTAESTLEQSLQKLVGNLEVIKLKIQTLEAKKSMVEALRTVAEYTQVETNINDIGGSIESSIEDLEKEIHAIQAEAEIETMLAKTSQFN